MAMEVAAGVVLDPESRVLLCQRQGGAHDGLWEFPGGKREDAEGYVQCLKRELWEELRLSVVVERELLRMPFQEGAKLLSFSFLLARVTATTLTLRVHRNARWVDASEVGEYALCPADRAFWENWNRAEFCRSLS